MTTPPSPLARLIEAARAFSKSHFDCEAAMNDENEVEWGKRMSEADNVYYAARDEFHAAVAAIPPIPDAVLVDRGLVEEAAAHIEKHGNTILGQSLAARLRACLGDSK